MNIIYWTLSKWRLTFSWKDRTVCVHDGFQKYIPTKRPARKFIVKKTLSINFSERVATHNMYVLYKSFSKLASFVRISLRKYLYKGSENKSPYRTVCLIENFLSNIYFNSAVLVLNQMKLTFTLSTTPLPPLLCRTKIRLSDGQFLGYLDFFLMSFVVLRVTLDKFNLYILY